MSKNQELSGMLNNDRESLIEKFRKSFDDHGYSPLTLGWDKGRQDVRFEVLLSFFECRGKSILDIGCGFGDMNRVVKTRSGDDYSYTGVDLVEELINEGKNQYPQENIEFLVADFLEFNFDKTYDIVLASGIFNQKFPSGSNDLFTEKVFEKAWNLAKEGFAFDFLSDKVDYQHSHTYHNSPEKILGLAYKYSRNVVLRNDYIPFEFSLFVGKDNTFDKEEPIFNHYKN